MTGDEQSLQPNQWYWIRKPNGSMAPYRFQRTKRDPRTGTLVGEFFVGSMIVTFPLNAVAGKAAMPQRSGDKK